MEKVRVEDAVGLSLCHDITAINGSFKGAIFKRGHVIEEKDIPVLLDIGKKYIFTGELPVNTVHEEEAAVRLSALMDPKGVHFEGPSEGKLVMVSDTEGMLRLDKKLLFELNAVKDITVTTLPDHYPVKPGMRLASMRIVPLYTDEENIRRAEELCRGRKLLSVMPYRHLKAGIIITGSEVYSGRKEDLFEPVLRKKLSQYPCEITGVRKCDDDKAMIESAARELMDAGAELLIFTGGMSVDPDDLTPGAVRALGAEIVSYGMPAQPGNMSLVAYLKDAVILGVPGAAVALPVTITDVLLVQIFAGERFTAEELTSLGDGGLCQRCESCHFPNCTFGRY